MNDLEGTNWNQWDTKKHNPLGRDESPRVGGLSTKHCSASAIRGIATLLIGSQQPQKHDGGGQDYPQLRGWIEKEHHQSSDQHNNQNSYAKMDDEETQNVENSVHVIAFHDSRTRVVTPDCPLFDQQLLLF